MAATVADQYPSHCDEAIATGFADDGPVVVDDVLGRAELASQFSPLVKQQIPGLRRYAVALTRDRDRADNLVQDCLVRALTKQHLWQPETGLRAWLFTILHNSRVSGLRRLAREKSRNEIAAGSFSQMPRHPDGRMELLDLDRGIGKSPERQALLLVCLEGISYEPAAGILGVPVGTLGSRIVRAREPLRAEFDRPPTRQPRAAAKSVLPTGSVTVPAAVACTRSVCPPMQLVGEPRSCQEPLGPAALRRAAESGGVSGAPAAVSPRAWRRRSRDANRQACWTRRGRSRQPSDC
jgi:RNA polymerase sigma-70 factor (ECF subfamily)